MMNASPRGFTLLIAVVLTSVLVAIGLALVDITYKQLVLSSTAKSSQLAFYAADSALECALFYDQRFNAFSSAIGTTSIRCHDTTPITVTIDTPTGVQRSRFNVPCVDDDAGIIAQVTVIKNDDESATAIYANGYSSCNVDDDRRVERGLKVTY